MPAPRWLAKFNRVGTNRVLGRVAKRMPGFGIVTHTGRKSHRQYRTPVNLFRRDGGYVFALTYGPRSDWVRNVLAAGGCTVETRGHRYRLTHPRLIHDEQHRLVPPPVRLILGLGHVDDFLALDLDHHADAGPQVG